MDHFSPLIKRERKQPWTMNSWKRDCVDCTAQTILFNSLINPRWNFHAKVLSKALFKSWNSSTVFHVPEVPWHSNISAATVTPQEPSSPVSTGPSVRQKPSALSCWNRAWLCSMLSLRAKPSGDAVSEGSWGRAENKPPFFPLGVFPRLISAEIRALKYLYEGFHASV